MPPTYTTDYGNLKTFIRKNKFNVVILEGPRGSGKTSLSDHLIRDLDMVYYKTWGGDQKWIRQGMQDRLNLDLPQGTYFVLDCIRQISQALNRQVLADRGNISAIAYQRDLPYGQNNELHKYYVELMSQAQAVLITLSSDVDVITERRISRGDGDEQKLHLMSKDQARGYVEKDVNLYDDSIDIMIKSGLEEIEMFDLTESTRCSAYVPKGTKLQVMDYHEY